MCDLYLYCWLQLSKKWNILYFNGMFIIKEYLPVKVERLKGWNVILLKLSSWDWSKEGLTEWLHPANTATSRPSDLTAAQRWSMETQLSRCAADWRGYCRWMYPRGPCISRRTRALDPPLGRTTPPSTRRQPRWCSRWGCCCSSGCLPAWLPGLQQRDVGVHNCVKTYIDSRIKPETLHQRL